MKIIIPTYNRSAKLLRSLEVYKNLGILKNHKLIILDGSDNSHSILNNKNADRYNADYINNKSYVLKRVLDYLNSVDGNEIISLCPDEDVILPDYIDRAELFLNNNVDYSMYVGRYITFLRRLGFISRVSGERDVITTKNISYLSILRRCSMLVHMITVGCSPVYWGVRRAKDFQNSLIMQSKLNKASSGELLDQLYIAASGKIQFDNVPMFLRDETKVGVKLRDDKHDLKTYIDIEDITYIKNELTKLTKNEDIIHIFTDLFEMKELNDSRFDQEIFDKRYFKFSEFSDDSQNKIYKNFSRIPLVILEVIIANKTINYLRNKYGLNSINTFLKCYSDNEYAKN